VPTVAYLANKFPSSVEPYVSDEMQELRHREVTTISGSVRRLDKAQHFSSYAPSGSDILCLQPIRLLMLLRAICLAATRWRRISSIVSRVLIHGKEGPSLRLKALLHTWLGAYYAILLRDRGVDHIHVHHGYFGSWIGMVAARLLGASFSMTLHGSDLLLHDVYLDTKLKNCQSCITVSDYNRRYILDHFPEIEAQKVIVSRLGMDVSAPTRFWRRSASHLPRDFALLAVGRLHAVKDHAFLVGACAQLRDAGLDFRCTIAGEGPERRSLELLIRDKRLRDCVILLGHVPQQELDALYRRAHLVVLTSLSEGIPLVLMEGMVRGKIVLAPAITGIPELVIPGKTGFLYKPGDPEDFIRRIRFLHSLMWSENQLSGNRLDWIRHAARVQVLHNFNRQRNLNRFCDAFLRLIEPHARSSAHENPVLQQI
jgi:colanic acid/amylovoran biosynthesis glycosyltransferase